MDVGHQYGAVWRAIALPKLAAIRAIVGAEKECAIQIDQIAWEGTVHVDAICARVDIHDHAGASRGTVALPELYASFAVVGREEKRAVHSRHLLRLALHRARLDCRDEYCAFMGTVALPQLIAIWAGEGEEDRTVDVR